MGNTPPPPALVTQHWSVWVNWPHNTNNTISSGHWATKAAPVSDSGPASKGDHDLDHDIDPLTTVHFADLKPLVHSYIQQEEQIKWDVSIHGRDLYLLKPTLGPPKRFRHLTRAEVVITRLRIGHTKTTKSHILSRGTPTACQHCGQTPKIKHILLEYTVLQQSRDEYYTVDSLRTLFETIPEACTVEFLRKGGFYYLIWMAIYPTQLFIQISQQLTTLSSWINPQYWTPSLGFVYRMYVAMGEPYLRRTANMSRRTCVVVKQIQSNPIH